MKPINEMNLSELKELRGQISGKVTRMQAGETVSDELPATAEELNTMINDIEEREAELNTRNEELRDMQQRLASGEGRTVRMGGANEQSMTREEILASETYRRAFLKSLRGDKLTDVEERAAYTGTTGDTTANNHGMGLLVPTTMLNQIWDLVEEQHAILGDITMYRTNTYLTMPLHTSIAQGDATDVTENSANDDEINNWNTVTLHGKDYSKTVKITYAMATMSIDALESFLVNEIADRLGAAMARDTIAGILTDYDTTNNSVVALSDTLTFANAAEAFSKLQNGKGDVVVYANNQTIFKRFVGMVDTAGRPIFQVNANESPRGYLIGAAVKEEASLSADTVLVGYPKTVVGNVVQDVMVETDRDISKHVIIYSGHARYESKLLAPKAFAKITVTTATEAG